MAKYPFETIEPKWQKYWDDNKTFKVTEDAKFPKEVDAYCSFMSVNELTDFINKYNDNRKNNLTDDDYLKNDNNEFILDKAGNKILKEGVIIDATYSFESESFSAVFLNPLMIS